MKFMLAGLLLEIPMCIAVNVMGTTMLSLVIVVAMLALLAAQVRVVIHSLGRGGVGGRSRRTKKTWIQERVSLFFVLSGYLDLQVYK